MIKFEKVSFEQFEKDFKKIYDGRDNITEDKLREIYDNIKLPSRATKGSAGYDFFAPFNIGMAKGLYTTIPTGMV